MAKKRKSADQKSVEGYEAGRRAWEAFEFRLAAAQTMADAIIIHHDAVRQDSPARKYYSNLGAFLMMNFFAPDGANATELGHYLRLIQVDPHLQIPAEKRAAIEAALKSAIAKRGPFGAN